MSLGSVLIACAIRQRNFPFTGYYRFISTAGPMMEFGKYPEIYVCNFGRCGNSVGFVQVVR
eukprot:7429437-Pyramimonas_sp.AAC.1